MPRNWLSPLEGRAAPAAATHSPVARDYPSRALSDVFQAAALRLFYQGTRPTVRLSRGIWSLCSAQLLHRLDRWI